MHLVCPFRDGGPHSQAKSARRRTFPSKTNIAAHLPSRKPADPSLCLSQRKLQNVPGLANVDNVDTIGTGLPKVGLHMHLEVLAPDVGLSGQEHLNVRTGRVEDRRRAAGGHLV